MIDGITMDDNNEKCQTCKKLFHIKCINKWLDINNSCAHCRGKFKTLTKRYWSDGKKMFTFNDNIEIRYWSNGNIKYKIHLDNDGNIVNGIYYTSSNSITYNILDLPSNIINEIREDDYYIYITDLFSIIN